ncbi:TetR/AcrR family transcriptional regulator C-terminal domain-containing protein [Galbitalea soli]|uniref:Uncharacterized protein n=1 Tax=Galbitalea soli TaxID=1268042 RepID=A0A7C9TTR3_9MICO|nr:TetR/AcrR family transcriptional regulator C-terminal domain-containing protein [Galbitalea soli]NEM92362.1 hypothetical protein [Galbitalea soli]NYJ31681.1 AcrR family transcriptional regulator [Galbitalea soli]
MANQDTANPRGRGRPRTIDLDRIVAAARALDPETVTLQAVADSLGVQRQSLSYHVSGRDDLLRLLALEEVAEQTRAGHPAEPVVDARDWANAARHFAVSLRDAVGRMGVLARHLSPRADDQALFLAPAESLFSALFAAGLDERTAVAALGTLVDLALSAGRATAADAEARRSQAEEVEAQLLTGDDTPLQALRRAAAAHALLDPDDQFAFDVELCVRGIGSLIEEAAARDGER